MDKIKRVCLIILTVLFFISSTSFFLIVDEETDNSQAAIETLLHVHNYEVFAIGAGCNVDGKITKTCLDCNDTTIIPMPALGHSYRIKTIEPTCDEEGKTISICVNCHDKKVQILKQKKHSYLNGSCEYCGKENLISLGTYRLTAYCACKHCSDNWGNQTSSGKTAQANHTIAVDPKVIPLGTEVYIFGNKYVAEDTGSAIKNKRIDIYFDSHEEAKNFGIQYIEVFVKEM